MKIVKAYKFRLYQNEEQKQFFEQNFGNARLIYNKILHDKIEYYKKTKKMLYNTPAQHKKEFEFLKLSDSLALSNVQLDLQEAYRKDTVNFDLEQRSLGVIKRHFEFTSQCS